MSCSQCRHEFCWPCLKDWKKHGSDGYNCNKYNESATKTEARAALDKYLFYYNRYINHSQSLKFQDNLKEKVKDIMRYMQETGTLSYAETQFMEKAWQTLGEVRRVLMHTYIFAFYVKKNNQLEIFENNQANLEIECEKLCAHLEREDHSTMNTEEIKQRVQDLTILCNRRNQVLIDHVAEGFDKGDCWVYNEANCE